MNICIYTKPDTLRKKRGLNKDEVHCDEYYWKLRGKPKELNVGDKIYFATVGMVRGYFMVEYIERFDNDYYEIVFRKETWKSVRNKPIKSFQGFKYVHGEKF